MYKTKRLYYIATLIYKTNPRPTVVPLIQFQGDLWTNSVFKASSNCENNDENNPVEKSRLYKINTTYKNMVKSTSLRLKMPRKMQFDRSIHMILETMAKAANLQDNLSRDKAGNFARHSYIQHKILQQFTDLETSQP